MSLQHGTNKYQLQSHLCRSSRVTHLRDLDLDVVRGGEVVARDAEAARRNLLDRRAQWVWLAVHRLHAPRVLAAFAAVALAAELVHRLHSCIGTGNGVCGYESVSF